MRSRALTELGKTLIKRLRAEGPLLMSDLEHEFDAFALNRALGSLRYAAKAWVLDGRLVLPQEYYSATEHLTTRSLAFRALEGGPKTMAEIMDITGRSVGTMHSMVATMVRENIVHVKDYRWRFNAWAAVYASGPAKGAVVKKPTQNPPKPPRVRAYVSRAKPKPKTQVLKPPAPRVRDRRVKNLSVPSHASASVFVGGVNPWTGEQHDRT